MEWALADIIHCCTAGWSNIIVLSRKMRSQKCRFVVTGYFRLEHFLLRSSYWNVSLALRAAKQLQGMLRRLYVEKKDDNKS